MYQTTGLWLGRPTGDPLNLLGNVARDAGKVQLSVEAFQRALAVAPDSEENYLDYSTLLMSHGNTAGGLDVVKIGLEHLPRSYRLTVQEGALLVNLGRPKEAQQAFRSAMGLLNDNKEAFLGLAVAQVRSDFLDEALKTYVEGVQKFPYDFNLNYYYASALFRIAQQQRLKGEAMDRTRRAIDKAIQLNPRSTAAFYLRAKYYVALDTDPQMAIADLKTCLRLEPRYIPATYQLARLLLKTGNKQEGQNLLAKLRELQAEELKKEEDDPRIAIRNSGTPAQILAR